MVFDPSLVRQNFPALQQTINGTVPIFFDGPGGTQMPRAVMEEMVFYLAGGSSNLMNSPFFSVQKTHGVVRAAREKAAAFVNAPSSDEIVFGANATTITAHLSRSISHDWKPGDEIIVTQLDHYSNVSFWKQAAADKGVTVHTVRIKPEDCTFDYEQYESFLSAKTRLVAFTLASNVCGSLTDAKRIIKGAKAVGAVTFVDGVHYAPHYLPDVQALGCDFLSFSGYKFYGPRMGFVYGRAEILKKLKPYKVEPVTNEPPECWETGTKNFEALAGFGVAIDYLAGLGSGDTLRARLNSYYEGLAAYEQSWSKAFLERAAAQKGMKIYGITDAKRLKERTSTFAMTFEGRSPQEMSDHLAQNNISAGAGHFYGVGVIEALGLTEKGGIMRIGCVQYNTLEEMDRLFALL